ncbi:MAG: hypothetical protein ACI3W8_00045 [Oscillospiraceae bacterium]
MNLTMALNGVNPGKEYAILDDAPESIISTKEEKFFVPPTVNDIKTKKDRRILLFSAPGATGKSSLAYHIAQTYNGLLWDLSRERLGNHSFIGMLVKTLGPERFSAFAAGLKSGKSVLVIDAFDEAEMISGRVAVETLLDDLLPYAQDATSPAIILFARTETAHFITSYYDTILPISQYEISFFEEESSVNFIKEKLAAGGNPVTAVTDTCIREQFQLIRNLLVDQQAVKSFIGYAPVLETLASAFDEENNTIKLLKKLERGNNGTLIIKKILEKLLNREQEKLVSGFKTKAAEEFPGFSHWDRLYTPREQIIRLANKVIFNDAAYSDYPIPELPSELVDSYFASVDALLDQHPFLQKKIRQGDTVACEFTGPAFRDYALSYLMTTDIGEGFTIEYFSERMSNALFPSQMFFDFYTAFSDNTAKSHHFAYLYEAFKSKAAAQDMVSLSISDAGDDETLAFFSLFDSKTVKAEIALEVEKTAQGFCFDQLTNASIDVDADVYIGKTSSDVKITNSSIICRRLCWNASNVFLEVSAPGETLIVSQDAFEAGRDCVTKFEIRTNANKNLKISAPNLQLFYKLYPYSYSYNDSECVDITKFAHALETILNKFRKHGKDAPGRHAELIDNVVVGKGTFKASVLDFLKASSIIYQDSKDPKLYKMDIDMLTSYGVNWGTLSQRDYQMFDKIFKSFLAWKPD